MSHSNMIAIYAQVTDDLTPRYIAKYTEGDVLLSSQASVADPIKTEPMLMSKHVLSVGAIDRETLERKFPTLYPHLNIHDFHRPTTLDAKVQADVCVHLDPMLTEVLDIRLNIATQHLNAKYTKDIRMWSTARDAEVGRRKTFNDLLWYKKLWRVLSCAVYRIDAV